MNGFGDTAARHDGPEERRVAGDAVDRVRGTFPFAVDRGVEGAAHVCAVRSPVAHGRLLGIDTADALDAPGVLAVITGEDARALLGDGLFHGENRADQPVLAVDRVRYAGEPMALVVAGTRALAESAAREVDADIEELDHVVDQDEAAEPGAPLLHDAWPLNDCGSYDLVLGDARTAMAGAAHVHTRTYRSPTASHAALEPHVATARWSGGNLDVWTGTQAPYVVRDRLAGIFGTEPGRVRITADNIGGGFGSKLDIRLEAMAALAARITGRAARMEIRRDEVFATAAKHAATVTVTTGADEDGRLVARIIDIVYNAGAYALTTPRSIRSGMIRSPGPYHIPNVLVHAVGRYTNTVPTGPFRGAMTGQVCWAGESALDELAQEIGIDPCELRRRNVLRDGDRFATGEAMHDMRYTDLLEAVATGIGWDTPLPPERDGVAHGRGIALVIKSTRTPSRSEADVVVDGEGRVAIRTSSVEMGQGAHFTLTEMAARVLGMDPAEVAATVVDTAHTPFDTVTSSSRTTLAMGLAVEAAARDLRARIDEAYAELTGLKGPFTHRAGGVEGVGPAMTYAEIMLKSRLPGLTGHGEYRTPKGYGVLDPVTSQGLHTVSWHQGAVGVEVAVDTRTGRVRVVRAHGASFAGRAIDAERIRKQTEGGMIFGMGQALMEEVVFDGGELANGNFSDYQLPSILDTPTALTSTLFTDDAPDATPHGVGENTVPPMAPAVAGAVYAATGARVRELPLTGERVLRALAAAREGSNDQ
ncbi:xanthine dehydrogenase family protein molybdopterin-binding subunit [Streptomyces sp. NPDC050560]|uniref:xanthine dehydrogenase family protein molybdopterin-binding subunit n=1 Tax=Streptomyces sp. NPDC050560 TaxID=3365630 RepID=UPI0037BB3D69